MMLLQKAHPLGEPVPREHILSCLEREPLLHREFRNLTDDLQEEFLRYCTGVAGLKVCYDPIFKFIFNPETHPDRLSDFLSAVLKQRVIVKQVLPPDSGRIISEGPLLIMDIVVELEDGSLANVEIQKIGHAFPGPRGACYSSDLVLRQYSRVKSKKRKNFSYKDMKNVYTIVILEHSPEEFQQFPEIFLHRSKQQFDSGLQLNMLQEYVFISLDVFRQIIHNKSINSELEAWLGFLAFDDPQTIWDIQSKFPRFRSLYEDMAEFRRDIKEVLGMFSKELAIMDRNNVQYMIEEQQAVIKEQEKQLKAEKERAALAELKLREQAELAELKLKKQADLIEELTKQLGK